MTYRVRVVVDRGAEADLLRLYDFMLERAQYLEDLEVAHRALDVIQSAIAHSLAMTPFLFRRAPTGGPLRRELVIPFGSAGFVVQYEVASPSLVVVLAVRHQREQEWN